MNIDWNMIKEKYPKAYKIFFNSFSWIKSEKGNWIKFGNAFCYCDLEEFFRDNRIYITIMHRNINDIIDWCYYIDIYNPRNEFNFRELKTNQEAKENAVIKAFEILNNKLKD